MLFNSLPIVVDILNMNLQVVRRIYLLGDQPDSIRAMIKKEGINSSKLTHLIGTSQIVIGGNIDWEELDDEDFETIINAEPPLDNHHPTQPSENISHEPINTIELIDYSVGTYMEDSVFDLQKKLSTITDIEPAKQYLAIDGQCMTQRANDNFAGYDPFDMIEFISTCDTKISGIPIDENYVLAQQSANAINTQSYKLSTFVNGHPSLRISMISLDTIIPNKHALQFLLKSDRQSFEIVYESVIMRFFPMFSSSTFIEYLSNPDESNIISEYRSTFAIQNKLVSQLNKISEVSMDNKDVSIITTAITLQSRSNISAILALPKLFNTISIMTIPTIFYIDLFTTINGKLLQARKVAKYAAQAINFVEGVSMNIKPILSNIRDYRSRDRMIITLLPVESFSKLTIMIDIFGRVDITANSAQLSETSKKKFINQIDSLVRPVLSYLNVQTIAFISPLRLDTQLDNYTITKSTSKLIFNQHIDYDQTIKHMLNDLVAGGLLNVEPIDNNNLRYRIFTILDYTSEDRKTIHVFSNGKLAQFLLVDLNIEETAFFIDLIGRFVQYRANLLQVKFSNDHNIQSTDPVLFKYSSTNKMNYSRICQKKFQPVLANSTDRGAYKYHNFTFNSPQYYKCPNKTNPYLGLLAGHHPQGYCLPCCRKQQQPDQKRILNQCLSTDPSAETAKSSRANSKLYVIDYPNDLVSNDKLVGRLAKVPDFINKILTKGTPLYINGLSVKYSEPTMPMQILEILAQYLDKKSTRELILDMIEYLKDRTNHRSVMTMPNIAYAFDTIDQLQRDIASKFLKHSTIVSIKNWNDIFIDIATCMGINILLLSDNRVKASDCAHITSSNQSNECSTDTIATANSIIKLINLSNINLDRPILLLLRRVDTEYSRMHNNRRYFYYPLVSNISMNPQVEAISTDTADQLRKIKVATQQSITNTIKQSFDSETLIHTMQKIGKIRTWYADADNFISYSEVIFGGSRSLLISLYRTINSDIPTSKWEVAKPYSGTVADALQLIEHHNSLQIAKADISKFIIYLTNNMQMLTDHRGIILPYTPRPLLKVDKFIIHATMVIGIRACVVFERKCMHMITIYHKPTPIAAIFKLLAAKKTELVKLTQTKLSKQTAIQIAEMPLDFILRTSGGLPITDLGEFASYGIEFMINPLQMINYNLEPMEYPTNDKLKHAHYISSIYSVAIGSIVEYWRTTPSIEIISAIESLIKAANLTILATFSNNLIEDWIDQLIKQFSPQYHPNVLSAELHEWAAYLRSTVPIRTRESCIQSLYAVDAPIRDIELHNLTYASKEHIRKLITSTADQCITQVQNLNNVIFDNQDNSIAYKNEQGKVMVLDRIYSELIDLAVADLSNPFRREYVLSNCMLSGMANSINIQSHIDELVYIQEL